MSYIIRDRLWPGANVIEGNYPLSIQGFQVPTRDTTRRAFTKDAEDLTDQIGRPPFEMWWNNYAHPLVGGKTRITNQCGDINDGLAYEEKFGEHIPKNAQPVTPNITIGRAGTIDIIHSEGVVYSPPEGGWTADESADIEKLIGHICSNNLLFQYNVSDYDDPRGLSAILLNFTRNTHYKISISRLPLNRIGRVVIRVELTDAGIEVINTCVDTARKLYPKLNIMRPRTRYAWSEILLTETVPAMGKDTATVYGTVFENDVYWYLHPTAFHKFMDIPIERSIVNILINKTTVDYKGKLTPKIYAPIPWYMCYSRSVEYETDTGRDGKSALISTFKFPAILPTEDNSHSWKPKGKAIEVAVGIDSKYNAEDISNEEIAFVKTTRLVDAHPFTVKVTTTDSGESYDFGDPAYSYKPNLFDHLLFNTSTPIIRVDAYLKNGRTFRAKLPDEDMLICTSKWAGNTPKKYWAGKLAECVANHEGGESYVNVGGYIDTENKKGGFSIPIMWKTHLENKLTKAYDEGVEPLEIHAFEDKDVARGAAVNWTLNAGKGYIHDYIWVMRQGSKLPSGLIFDPAKGTISGTVSTTATRGLYLSAVCVTDGFTTTNWMQVKVTVN